MGIYDILQEHNLSYKELTNIIHELAGCVFIDSTGIIRQLDQIYDDDEYRRDFPPAQARENYTKGNDIICEEQDQRDYTEQTEDIMALKHLRTPDDE